jgi:hypothetical protein
MTAFQPVDFQIYANNNITLRVAILDQNGQPVAVTVGTVARFSIAPAAYDPDLQAGQGKLFQRDTSGLYVRFVNLPLASPNWYVDCDILPADTIALPATCYYYELRTDLGGTTQYTIRGGIFKLLPSIITP